MTYTQATDLFKNWLKHNYLYDDFEHANPEYDKNDFIFGFNVWLKCNQITLREKEHER